MTTPTPNTWRTSSGATKTGVLTLVSIIPPTFNAQMYSSIYFLKGYANAGSTDCERHIFFELHHQVWPWGSALLDGLYQRPQLSQRTRHLIAQLFPTPRKHSNNQTYDLIWSLSTLYTSLSLSEFMSSVADLLTLTLTRPSVFSSWQTRLSVDINTSCLNKH